MTKEIAKIEETHLGWEDHGCFTACVMLDYGGVHQGMGHYILSSPKKDAEGQYLGQQGTAEGMDFLMAVCKAAGVDTWEQLPGRTVFAVLDERKMVVGLEPLPTERGTAFHVDDVFPERRAR